MNTKTQIKAHTKWFYSGVVTLLALLMIVLVASTVRSSPRLIEIEQWIPTTPLPQPLANRSAVVQGDFLYYVGGKSASDQPISNIYAAQIQANGMLGGWSVAGQLPKPVYLHAIAATETHLYIIGGWDGNQTTAEVWRATFNHGTLNNFIRLLDYPSGIDLHAAVIANNRLYILGGWTGNDPLASVHFAELLPDGIGPWQATASLPLPLYRLAAEVYNQRIYVTGGYDNQAARNNVYYADIQPDGSLSSWQNATPLPAPVYFHGTVIHDGQLVVLGGRSVVTEYADVYAVPINSDGSLGAWQPRLDLPETLHRFSAVSVTRNNSDYIYIMGGLHGADYRAHTLFSSYPEIPTPTPTATPTLTPTPRPETVVALQIRNSPQHWVAPGAEIEYVITYHNRSNTPFFNLELMNVVPDGVELLPESIEMNGAGSYTHTLNGDTATVRWTLTTLPAQGSGQVRYRVLRPVPTPPELPRLLAVDAAGPATASAGEPITYTLTITNNTAFPVNEIAMVVSVPAGAVYLRGADEVSPQGDTVAWRLPTLQGDEVLARQFVVQAERSLVLHDFYATSDEGPTAKGQGVVFTQIGTTTPLPPADGVVIANAGATLSWNTNNRPVSSQSNPVFNPSYSLHLPLVRQ